MANSSSRSVEIVQSNAAERGLPEMERLKGTGKACFVRGLSRIPFSSSNPSMIRICVLAILFFTAAFARGEEVNLSQFGAVPDDNLDDSRAIQKAFEQAGPNGTVLCGPGVYNLFTSVEPAYRNLSIKGSSTLRWQGDQIVVDTPTVFRTTGTTVAIKFHGDGLNIAHLSFEGRAINCDRPNDTMVKGLVVDNCSFSLSGNDGNSIEFTTGLSSGRISNCIFDPVDGDNGIYGYNWDNLIIANNHFKHGNEGIHLIAHYDASRDLLIEQNYFTGLRRMAVEIQGGGSRTIVQDNYYDLPVLTPKFEENKDTFAYSIVADRSRGTRVRRNTSIAPERPDGIGVRIIFELGGQDVICEDNYSVDGNHVIAANGSGASGVAKNNRIVGYKEGPRNSNDARMIFVNNGPDTKLTWDINRGKPGPNKRIPTSQPAK